MKGTTCAERNPPLLYWAKVCLSTRIMSAVIVLFYLARGLTMGQVMLLSAVWSVAAVLSEVPSGYLADLIGRRRTLLLGGLLALLGWVILFWADSLPDFILTIILSSAAEACVSGTEEALLYDSLKEAGREGEMMRHNSVLASARTVAKVLLPLIGCLVARDLEEWQFHLLIGSDAVLVIAALTFLYRLKEPDLRSGSSGQVGIFARSLQLIRRDPWLIRAIVNKQLVFLAGFMLFRAYQPLLSDLGFSVLAIGFYYAISRGLMTLTLRWSSRLVGLFGLGRVLAVAAVAGAILSLVAGLFGCGWVVFVALVLAEVIFMLRLPLFAQAINVRLESGCRATALSGLSCLKELLSVPVMLFAGWLAEIEVSYLALAGAALAVVAVVLFPLRQKDLDRSV